MLQGHAEPIRQRVELAPDSHRRLEERIGLRFPRLRRLISRLTLRLPPRSRIRKAVIRHTIKLALEAANRQDYEAAFLLYDDKIEMVAEPRLIGLGFEPPYRGLEERVRFQQRWIAEWGEFRFFPDEVVDLGDRFLVLGRLAGSGLSSGAGFDSEWALLVTLSRGRVIREEFFFERAGGLRAAGLAIEAPAPTRVR
jgi:hypothetical protein